MEFCSHFVFLVTFDGSVVVLSSLSSFKLFYYIIVCIAYYRDKFVYFPLIIG